MSLKILHLDIETAPHLAMVWGLWNENIPLDRLKKPGYTLCWAAKWQGQKKVLSSWNTDAHFLFSLHELITEADVVVTYNGNKFDLPTMNREFVLQGLPPPGPAHQVDLYQVVRRRFRFASNKLDFVAQQLGLGCKVKHKGFQLWIDAMDNKPQARKDMLTYNKQDVVLTEQLFNTLRPWLKMPADHTGHVCRDCGSIHLEKRGFKRLAAGTYQRYQCLDCGKWSRGTENLLSLQDRKALPREI